MSSRFWNLGMTISSLRPGSPFTDHEVTSYTKREKENYGLALDRAAVNGDISKVCKKLLGAVLRLYKLEQLLSVVDEL